MGGDHHDHKPKLPPIPDWRKYKVEDSVELTKVKNILAQKGLKDPWLRNHVWRYDRTEFLAPLPAWKNFVFRGFKLGLALAIVTVIAEKIYDSNVPSRQIHKTYFAERMRELGVEEEKSHGHH